MQMLYKFIYVECVNENGKYFKINGLNQGDEMTYYSPYIKKQNWKNNIKHGYETSYIDGHIDRICTWTMGKHGSVIEYYDNGAIKYKYDLINGEPHGIEIGYYSDGKIKSTHDHTGSILHYYPNGTIQYRMTYRDNQKYPDIWYWGNDKIRHQYDYYEYQKHGDEIEYNEDGSIEYFAIWVNGKKQRDKNYKYTNLLIGIVMSYIGIKILKFL